MKLLVTGFGPFPTVPRNPSVALARAVAASPAWRLRDVGVTCRVLTTAYAALSTELDPALAADPDAVLLIGVAGRSRAIRVERRGTARRSTLFPDAAGETGRLAGAPGPAARWTTANARAALRSIRRHGCRARLSRDAGRYLCNAAYMRALSRPCPVLFIHIPKALGSGRPAARVRRRRSPDASLAAALVDIAGTMLRDARRVAGPPRLR